MAEGVKRRARTPSAILPPPSNSQKNRLRQIVEKLPLSPGIYLMKDAKREILYIGKAKSLRKRVRSYFKVPAPLPKIVVLMSKVRTIDHIETSTEVDALLLEAHLIRKHQPRYNQELKDDKSFPLLKITREKFPRIAITRQRSGPAADYYGPYTDSKLLQQAVNLMGALFPVRKCRTLPKIACLYHHIGQCIAPCIRPEVKPEYDRLIKEVKRFLGGGKKSFSQYLKDRMEKASRELQFEDAQFFKEQIDALSKLRKKRFLPKNPGQGISLSATLELRERLKLEKIPERIVCFDVSNVQGDRAVASKVSYFRELPDKFDYRRYKIRGVSGINDYAMISEALTRMLRGIQEGRGDLLPDLIMIDGGKGHLHAAAKVLAREGMERVGLISIAKQFEWVYSPKFRSPLVMAVDSPGLYLLKKVRDEAHRFAITYHRKLKSEALENSALDEISGIGEKRKRILLKHFDSVQDIRRASMDELCSVSGLDRNVAARIFSFFHLS